MRLRRLVFSIVAFGLLALALCGKPHFSSAASVADVPTYPLSDVRPSFRVQLPLENGTYLGSFLNLNVSASFHVYARTSDERRIPIEDIELLYSVDCGDWKTIPRVSTIHGEMFSPNEGWFHDYEHCNYSVTLPSLSDGWHSVKVFLKPSLYESAPSLYESATGYYPYNYTYVCQNQTVHFKTIRSAGLSVASPQNQTYDSDEVPLIFEIREPSTGVSYCLDNQTIIPVEGNANLTLLSNGLHNLTMYAKDDSGVVVDSITAYFKVNKPQIAALSSETWIAPVAMIVTVVGLSLLVFFKKRERMPQNK